MISPEKKSLKIGACNFLFVKVINIKVRVCICQCAVNMGNSILRYTVKVQYVVILWFFYF